MARRNKIPVRVRAVPPDIPVLVGVVERVLGQRGRPDVVQLVVYCPYCRRLHEHGWGDTGDHTRVDYVEHRHAHCGDRSPLREKGYYIALDPTRKADHAVMFGKRMPPRTGGRQNRF